MFTTALVLVLILAPKMPMQPISLAPNPYAKLLEPVSGGQTTIQSDSSVLISTSLGGYAGRCAYLDQSFASCSRILSQSFVSRRNRIPSFCATKEKTTTTRPGPCSSIPSSSSHWPYRPVPCDKHLHLPSFNGPGRTQPRDLDFWMSGYLEAIPGILAYLFSH